MLAVIYNIDGIFSGFRSKGFEGGLAFTQTPEFPHPPIYAYAAMPHGGLQ